MENCSELYNKHINLDNISTGSTAKVKLHDLSTGQAVHYIQRPLIILSINGTPLIHMSHKTTSRRTCEDYCVYQTHLLRNQIKVVLPIPPRCDVYSYGRRRWNVLKFVFFDLQQAIKSSSRFYRVEAVPMGTNKWVVKNFFIACELKERTWRLCTSEAEVALTARKSPCWSEGSDFQMRGCDTSTLNPHPES